jgi:hypothetical protein
MPSSIAARVAMSNAALTWAFHLPIVGARKSILVALAEHADENGLCWPSAARIALFAGVTERAVRMTLPQLEGIGVVKIERSAGRTTSRYMLNLSATVNSVPGSGAPTMNSVPGSTLNVVPLYPEAASRLTHPTRNPVPPTRKQLPPNPYEPPKEIKKKENTPTPKSALGTDEDPGFVAFWSNYPRKDKKGYARKAWISALQKAPAETILSGLSRHQFNENPRYIPHPTTWLNGECWLQASDDDGIDPVLRAAGVTQADLDLHLGCSPAHTPFQTRSLQCL